MKEFKINEYITLKLEGADTIIYVGGSRFNICKSLILEVPIEKITSFDNIASIDETFEKLEDSQLEVNYGITPEEEFWGHCSNLHVWVENNYNTRLLRYNLAFPLLKKLSNLGDSIAEQLFKEEICKRLENGAFTTAMIEFFIEQGGYIDCLRDDELESLVENIFLNGKFFPALNKIYKDISKQLLVKL